jgi:hypothetical protein
VAPNTTSTGVRLTPLAALIDTTIRTAMNRDLGTYLAAARTPGTGWKSFDDIAADLTAMLAGTRTLNRVSVKTFADSYGIPDTRYVEGRSMPRPVSDEAVEKYLQTLSSKGVGINLDVVRWEAQEAKAREEQAAAEAQAAPTSAE